MLPFVNRAVGISSFLGILYYTTFHNKTEAPGLVKWFGGQPGSHPIAMSDNEPADEIVEGQTEQEGGGAPYELLHVHQEEEELPEEKPFVAPLELIVLDYGNLPSIYTGDWVIVG